jgi:hypothetical protein
MMHYMVMDSRLISVKYHSNRVKQCSNSIDILFSPVWYLISLCSLLNCSSLNFFIITTSAQEFHHVVAHRPVTG